MRRTTRKTRLIAELAVASGTVGGMIGGQVADLEGEGKPPDAATARDHPPRQDRSPAARQPAHGRHLAGAAAAQYEALSCYGEHVGLAFQIVDDILDVEESSEALGKTAGKDAAQHKITFPAVYGLETSRRMAHEECERAHAVLAPFGDRAAAPARTGRPDRPPQIMKTRLDRLMVDRGLAESREKAQALIMAGEVRVNGQKASKPGQPGGGRLRRRSALAPALRQPRRIQAGRRAAPLRASTSPAKSASISAPPPAASPTSCCRPAPRACMPSMCGAGQLDWKLRTDPRVVLHEGINARSLTFEDIGEPVDFLCCDVSFISVTLILPAVTRLLRPGGQMVILIKPQFEVGKGQVGKGGIVRDPALHRAACERVESAVREIGFETDIIESPIPGAEGNKEFLLYARH